MAYHYTLDTNIISDLIRNPIGEVSSRLRSINDSDICCSVVVAAESRFGALYTCTQKMQRHVEAALPSIAVLPLAEKASRAYALLRRDLTSKGRIIGPNDLWIAAHALSERQTLVTANTREFARVEGLSIVNWLES